MSARNLSDHIKVVEAIGPQSVAHGAADVTSSAIDVRQFRWATLIMSVQQGATAIDASTTFTVQSSSTSGGVYATVEDDTFNMTGGSTANVTAVATGTTTVDNLMYAEIDLDQHEGFLKVVVDPNGGGSSTEGAAIVACYVILSSPKNGKSDLNGVMPLAYQILTKDKAAY